MTDKDFEVISVKHAETKGKEQKKQKKIHRHTSIDLQFYLYKSRLL